MRERIRARYFPKWPGAVLFFLPPGTSLNVRELQAPFGKKEISRACGDVQTSEGEPGRWTSSIAMARSAARAERGQQERQRESTEAVLQRGSLDPRVRDRSRLILDKHAVDGRIRELKSAIATAKTRAATSGRYMDPQKYRQLERDLELAKQKSQGIQTQLGQLKSAEKAAQVADHGRFERAFIKAARERLDEDTYAALVEQAEEASSPGPDGDGKLATEP